MYTKTVRIRPPPSRRLGFAVVCGKIPENQEHIHKRLNQVITVDARAVFRNFCAARGTSDIEVSGAFWQRAAIFQLPSAQPSAAQSLSMNSSSREVACAQSLYAGRLRRITVSDILTASLRRRVIRPSPH